MSEWGTSASQAFDSIMKELQAGAIYKAAEATTDAADMVTSQDPAAAGGAPTEGMPPGAGAPPTMSDTLGQIADQEPDVGKKQVILEAAQRYSVMDSPPEVMQAPPPQEAPPGAGGPPMDQGAPAGPPPGAAPPPPDLGAPPKTAAIRFADRVPANAMPGSGPKTYTTDNFLAFLHSTR